MFDLAQTHVGDDRPDYVLWEDMEDAVGRGSGELTKSQKMKSCCLGYVSAKGVGNQFPPSWSDRPDVVSAVNGVVDLEIDLEDSEERLDVEEVCASGRQHLSLCIFYAFASWRFRNV